MTQNEFDPVFCRCCHQQVDPESTFNAFCPTCCVEKLRERQASKAIKPAKAKKRVKPLSLRNVCGGLLLFGGIIALLLFWAMDISVNGFANMSLMQQQLIGVITSLFVSHAGMTLCLEK